MCIYMLDDIPGYLHCVKSLNICIGIPQECCTSGMGQFDKAFVIAGQKMAESLENGRVSLDRV